jgi:D-alanyl-D-alanine carboxypeptidase
MKKTIGKFSVLVILGILVSVNLPVGNQVSDSEVPTTEILIEDTIVNDPVNPSNPISGGLTGGNMGPMQGPALLTTNSMPTVNALSAIVTLREPYIVLDTKDPDTGRSCASTTKMMTALLTIERTKLPVLDPDFLSINTIVTASQAANDTGGSNISLETDDTIRLDDLLRGLMLPSGNDAAVAIAEEISGLGEGEDDGAFSDLMDDRAAELSMVNTDFARPDGASISSARDLSILANFALQDELFAEIVGTPQYNTTTWKWENGTSKDETLRNTNRLLPGGKGPASRIYPGANGVKTGTSNSAGQCLVFHSERQGKRVLGVVLNSGPKGGYERYDDAHDLLDYGFGAITSESSAAADTIVSYTPGVGVGAGFDDPSNALGDPDAGPGGLDESVALGDGGSLILHFVDNGIVDHTGPDIIVYEDIGVPERVEVEASVDGITWVSLGVEEGTAGYDLDGSGLATAHYVRITDQGDGLTGAPSAGFEVDAVRANNWKCPPVADSGGNQTLEQTGYDGAEAILDGSGSFDPDTVAADTTPPGENEDISLYEWFEDYGLITETLLGTGAVLIETLQLGTHDITLRVTDPWGLTDIDTMQVEVVDTTPPEITVTPNPPSLWPPNHKYVEVTFNVEVVDICDPDPTFQLISVMSDEPDDGKGDGHTSDDIADAELGTPDTSILLRAERSGKGVGRTYTIVYEASDVSNNTAEAIVLVFVPHARGKP